MDAFRRFLGRLDALLVVGRGPRSTPTRRAAVLGLLLLLLVLVASSARLHGWLVSLLPTAEALIRARPVLGGLVFVLFAAASAMLAFVSSAVIVPVGVFVWGTSITMALLLLGWVLGGACAYSIGRFLGRSAVRALAPSSMLERYETRVSQRAPFAFILLFQLALPSEIPGYVLGLVRYHFGKYLAALTLAELPYSVATVFLGAGFVERRIALLVAVGAAMVAFSGWALHTLHRHRRFL
jgi:uncharacterized membrane protein YdjX (TVP38/TMEM64 family)